MALPAADPLLVALNVALVAPPATVTVAGTVTRPVLLELRLKVNPAAGAAPVAMVRVMVSTSVEPRYKVDGDSEIVGAVMVNVLLGACMVIPLPFQLLIEAEMVAVPMPVVAPVVT